MGFIKLDRALRDWQWYNKKNMLNVWIELLLTASFEDYYLDGYLIKKGQVVTGRKKLAEKLNLSEQEVRSCLDRLQATNEITIKSTNRYSIITIVKWGFFQSSSDRTNQQFNQEINQQATSKQPTVNQPITTIKEDKEVKEDNNKTSNACDTSLIELFETEFGRTLSQREVQMICDWEKQYGYEKVIFALRSALIYDKRNIDYINRILFNNAKGDEQDDVQ